MLNEMRTSVLAMSNLGIQKASGLKRKKPQQTNEI